MTLCDSGAAWDAATGRAQLVRGCLPSSCRRASFNLRFASVHCLAITLAGNRWVPSTDVSSDSACHTRLLHRCGILKQTWHASVRLDCQEPLPEESQGLQEALADKAC